MTTLGHNPRYAAYAKAYGRTVEKQLEVDRSRLNTPHFDGGFSFWNTARLREYYAVNPAAFYTFGRMGAFDSGRPPALVDHEAYDAWLQDYVDKLEQHR